MVVWIWLYLNIQNGGGGDCDFNATNGKVIGPCWVHKRTNILQKMSYLCFIYISLFLIFNNFGACGFWRCLPIRLFLWQTMHPSTLGTKFYQKCPTFYRFWDKILYFMALLFGSRLQRKRCLRVKEPIMWLGRCLAVGLIRQHNLMLCSSLTSLHQLGRQQCSTRNNRTLRAYIVVFKYTVQSIVDIFYPVTLLW